MKSPVMKEYACIRTRVALQFYVPGQPGAPGRAGADLTEARLSPAPPDPPLLAACLAKVDTRRNGTTRRSSN